VLALFWIVVFAGSLNHGTAFAVGLPSVGNEAILEEAAGPHPASFHVPGSTSLYLAQEDPRRPQTLLLLSVALAALVAFNLAFWRHLRRAYASPRRSVWRRG
jgi:hypothetical protein